MIQQFMDGFSLGGLFLLTLALMLGFVEAGFRLGSRQQDKAAKQQASQVRGVMGAMLGLTAFMLAFTFASAQGHHEQRIVNMVAEAGLLSDAFMQTEFLDEPARTEARGLLHQYVTGRLQIIEQQDKVPEVPPKTVQPPHDENIEPSSLGILHEVIEGWTTFLGP